MTRCIGISGITKRTFVCFVGKIGLKMSHEEQMLFSFKIKVEELQSIWVSLLLNVSGGHKSSVLNCLHSFSLLLLQFMPQLTYLLTDSSQQSLQPSNPKSQVSLPQSNNPHSQSPSVSLADIRVFVHFFGSVLNWYSGAQTRVQAFVSGVGGLRY